MGSKKGAKYGGVGEIVALLVILDQYRAVTPAQVESTFRRKVSATSWKRTKTKLRAFGCELEWDAKAKTHFVIDPNFCFPSLTSPAATVDPRRRGELAVVRVAVAALGPPLSERLGRELAAYDASLAGVDPNANAEVRPRQPQPRGDAAFFERLNTAHAVIRDHRLLAFMYCDEISGKVSSCEIEPHAIHNQGGRILLWGRESTKRPLRFFAFDRISNLEVGGHFDPDPGINIDDALRYNFGISLPALGPVVTVVVDFDAPLRTSIETRLWPTAVSLSYLEDGGLRIGFEVTDPAEVVSWVMGFRGHARVVSPPDAVEMAGRSAKLLLSIHTV